MTSTFPNPPCGVEATIGSTPPHLPSGAASLLARALDAIDHGIVLLHADGRVAFINQAARREIADAQALRIVDSRLLARHAEDRATLQSAIDTVLTHGVQRSLVLGRYTDQPARLAVVPVDDPGRDGSRGAMVVLQHRSAFGEPFPDAVQRHRGLPQVALEALEILCGGADDAAPGAGCGTLALSPRQREVFQRALRGKPNKVIARELGIAEGTVKVHLAMVFRALGVRNRTEAMYRMLSADAAAAVARL